jgi:hypothetical protein
MEVFVEHNHQLNGPHVTRDAVKIRAKLMHFCADKGKIDAFGTLLMDGGDMSQSI